MGIGVQLLPFLGGEAAVEGGRIEGWRRGHGKDVAVEDVHDHGRGGELGREPLLGELLQADIEAGDEIGARRALLARQLADHPADRVYLHLALPRLAAQRLVVLLLQPVAPDAEARQGQQRIAILGHLVFRRGRDIAKDMRGDAAERVVALLIDLDADAGEIGQVQFDLAHLVPAQVLLDQDRREGAVAGAFLHDLPALALADRHQFGEGLQRALQIGRLLGDQHRAIVGEIGGERRAEAIQDQAARRRQQAQVDPVLLRQQSVLVGLDDLQVVHPPDQRRDQQRLARTEDGDAAVEDFGLALGLLLVHYLAAAGPVQPEGNRDAHQTRSRRR